VIVCWNLSIALSQSISRNCLRRSFVALREAIALTRCWSLMSSCHHVIICYLQSPNSVPVSSGRNMLLFSRLPVWQRRFRLASIRPTGFPLVGCRDAYRPRATSWLLLRVSRSAIGIVSHVPHDECSSELLHFARFGAVLLSSGGEPDDSEPASSAVGTMGRWLIRPRRAGGCVINIRGSDRLLRFAPQEVSLRPCGTRRPGRPTRR
jgi:hypothetical protein